MALSSTISFGGLSSGLDTENIVTQLVALERQPITKNQQLQQKLDARTAGYNDIRTKATAIRNALYALRDPSLWQQTQSVTPADPAILSATRTAGAAPGGYSVVITALARAQQQAANPAFAAAGVSDTLSFAVGAGAPVGVAITAGDTIATIASKVNSTAGIGVYATVVGSRLYFSGKTTGAANTLSITDGGGGLAASMGLAVTQTAADNAFTVNGAAFAEASNTITDAIPGVSFTLKSTGTSAISVATPAADADAAAAKMQAFVDAYNDLQRSVNTKVTEKPMKNPTSDFQRNVGSLFGDRTLQGLASKLRETTYRVESGAVATADSLSDIGVSLPSASGAVTTDAKLGILTFDKAKFISAYTADPAGVRSLISNPTGVASTEGTVEAWDRQLGFYLDGQSGGLDGMFDAATKALAAQRKNIDARIATQENHVASYEHQLRAQFTAMETAVGRSKSLGSMLSGWNPNANKI